MTLTLLTTALSLLLIYFIASLFLTWHRLRHFPGPFLASISYLWLAFTDASGHAWKTHMALHKHYKSKSQSQSQTPLIRIGPNLLVTSDPTIIRRMSSARSRYTRGGWYEAFRIDAGNPSMFGTCDTPWHDEIKARASAGYSGKEIPSLEGDVDVVIEGLKGYFRERLGCSVGSKEEGIGGEGKGKGKGKLVDFAKAAQYFALDVAAKIGFGQEFGFLEADSDVNGYVQAMNMFALMATLISDVPWLRKLFLNDWLFKKIGPKHTDERGPGRIMGLAKEAVDERFENGVFKDQQDMLGSFLRHGITRTQCYAEATLQIIAGSDMTANVIRSTILYIITSPHVYHRLQSEIDAAVTSGRVSNPATYTETKALPYLQAILYEGLRMHPPTFSLLSKRVPPEGDTLCGMFVPGGTEIAQNSWSMLRDESIFGDDGDVFRPERFFEAEERKRAEMERVTDLAFGYGRWMCAGKYIALLEISKVVFELLREFDFQIVNAAAPWSARQYSVFLIEDMMIRVTERKTARV